MKYVFFLRMIQVYNTFIEASNTIELQEKIMEEAHTWWKWHTGDGGDRIKSPRCG